MILRFQVPLAVLGAWLALVGLFQDTALGQELSAAQEQASQEHVVPLRELDGQLLARSTAVERDRADVERVLGYPEAREMLRKANIEPEQVRTAVAMLSADELGRLAVQARRAEVDVRGGFIVGILALIGLVVVVVIVIAVVRHN